MTGKGTVDGGRAPWWRREVRRLKYRARRSARGLRSGFLRGLEDPQVPLSLDMESDSDTLLVAFGGMHGDVGVPPFEFFGATGSIPVKKMFVRDLRRAWYHKGIEGHGETIAEVGESLAELIGGHDVGRLVFAGSSAGGYAALAFGAMVGADTVLSFGPQTVLDPLVQAEIGDLRWQGDLTELERTGVLDPEWSDLRSALPRARRADTRYEIYFSQVNTRPNSGPGRDRAQAERLAGLEGVRLYRFGSGGHQIARSLRDCGALDTVLRRALLPRGAPTRV